MSEYINLEDIRHGIRVANYCSDISNYLKISDRYLYLSGLFHDIGKAFIDKKILYKPGKLSDSERVVINKHPYYSYIEIIYNNLPIDIALNALYHHENFDGSGYPAGLKGILIPKDSRIIRIADMFDALTTDRPYRKRLSVKDAMDVMNNSKEMFDPYIYAAFLKTAFKSYTSPSIDRAFNNLIACTQHSIRENRCAINNYIQIQSNNKSKP